MRLPGNLLNSLSCIQNNTGVSVSVSNVQSELGIPSAAALPVNSGLLTPTVTSPVIWESLRFEASARILVDGSDQVILSSWSCRSDVREAHDRSHHSLCRHST